MMAQDFPDLTSQVIARVVNLASTIEQRLVQLLLHDSTRGHARRRLPRTQRSPAENRWWTPSPEPTWWISRRWTTCCSQPGV